jgi:hypothetical protein
MGIMDYSAYRCAKVWPSGQGALGNPSTIAAHAENRKGDQRVAKAPAGAKVRFALEEKQLPWKGDVIDIFLPGEHFRPEFLALNPKAVVPLLVHDGFVIPESTVIRECVDDAFAGNPICPAVPRNRALVRSWTKAIDLGAASTECATIVGFGRTIQTRSGSSLGPIARLHSA